MAGVDIAYQLHAAMLVTLKLCAPPLLAALVVGVAVSLVQAVTQINDSTLSFLPKLVAVGGACALAGPFMFAALRDYAQLLFDKLVAIGGS